MHLGTPAHDQSVTQLNPQRPLDKRQVDFTPRIHPNFISNLKETCMWTHAVDNRIPWTLLIKIAIGITPLCQLRHSGTHTPKLPTLGTNEKQRI
jgi:hypothetical protein